MRLIGASNEAEMILACAPSARPQTSPRRRHRSTSSRGTCQGRFHCEKVLHVASPPRFGDAGLTVEA
jgi:hypothetical protein